MKKFDNIVIVTDLDGTFLNKDGRLVERNVEAIEYFKANGGHFGIATGRVAGLAKEAIPQVAELTNMPSVTCNGACLYDFKTDEIPVLHTMDIELIKDIVMFVHQKFPSAALRASTLECEYLTVPEDVGHELIQRDFSRHPLARKIVSPLEEWENFTILKIVVRIPADDLACAMAALDQKYGDSIATAQSWSTIIDIQPAGINKGATLARYVKENISADALLYTCGDYMNDIEMLRAADVAVCPANALDEVKQISDLCLCSNNDGLIADLVEHIDRIYTKG